MQCIELRAHRRKIGRPVVTRTSIKRAAVEIDA